VHFLNKKQLVVTIIAKVLIVTKYLKKLSYKNSCSTVSGRTSCPELFDEVLDFLALWFQKLIVRGYYPGQMK
jgi:hypothetical protein